MRCPFCQYQQDTRVIDSRSSASGDQIRRRRECEHCRERFNTIETLELTLPAVIKRNGNRVPFDRQKLQAGLEKALQKRPVSIEKREAIIQRLIHQFSTCNEREISSRMLGEWIMNELRILDPVAYVRFASVYCSFENIEAFQKAILSINPQSEPEYNLSEKH